jgi:hypothetical protein
MKRSSAYTTLHIATESCLLIRSSTYTTLHNATESWLLKRSSIYTTLHDATESCLLKRSSTYTTLHNATERWLLKRSSTYTTLHDVIFQNNSSSDSSPWKSETWIFHYCRLMTSCTKITFKITLILIRLHTFHDTLINVYIHYVLKGVTVIYEIICIHNIPPRTSSLGNLLR